MNLLSLFTSFEGRISRKPYWIGSLLIILVFFIAAMTILKIWGIEVYSGPYSGESALSLLFGALVVVASIPVMVKRLHDRNKSGHYVWLIGVPEILWVVGDFAGITSNAEAPNILGWSLAAIYMVFALWLFIELGFRRGTKGNNQYGPDPLASGEAERAITVES